MAGSAVRVSVDLFEAAKKHGKLNARSAAGQLEYWARLGKAAEVQNEFTDVEYDALWDGVISIDAEPTRSIADDCVANDESYVGLASVEDDTVYRFYPDGRKEPV